MTLRILGAALLALVLLGCGSGKPEVVPAGGKVMFNKTIPPAGALVVFHPVSADREKQVGGKPFAKVKEDGTFTLTTYTEDDGAPEGEYGVTVDWRTQPKEGKFSFGEGGGGASRLTPKYGNPQQPVLRATVKKGDSNRFTFEVD